MSNQTCSPVEGVQVDIWQCDADGVYSGVKDEYAGTDTRGSSWLRGYQLTDESGVAKILTIVPGWYSGRAVHIHFKIRVENVENESYEFTSQFFFNPGQIDDIYKEEPYADKGLPDTPNEDDFIFEDADDQLTLELFLLTEEELEDLNTHEELEGFTIKTAYQAIFDAGLDLSDAEAGEVDSWD